MKTKTLITTIGAAMTFSAFGLTLGGFGNPASAYPLPTTTEVASEAPTTTVAIAVTLPKTGSSNVGSSVMMGASIAVLGGGLILVSRRRREHAPAI